MLRRTAMVEILVRMCAAVVLLANALAPTVTRVVASSAADTVKRSPVATGSSAPGDTKYNPPVIHRPTRFDPTPDLPPSKVPARGQVEFVLSSESSVLDASGQILLQVHIRNNSGQELDNLTFTDPLESGLQFVSSTSTIPLYDPAKKTLGFTLAGSLGSAYSLYDNFVVSGAVTVTWRH